jgi:NADPH:quinone reductase-like Zn-dependent oxidoreductase
MKRILAYVSPEEHASLFDVMVAYDSGADAVVPYHSIGPKDVKEIVYSATFTRSPEDLINSAIFIGGHDIGKTAELIAEFTKTFNSLPKDRRVSVAMDPDGSYTTGSACVVKIKAHYKKKMKGVSATIIAGTGPVGQIVAVLLAKEGCSVTLTSRSMARAQEAARILETNYGVTIKPAEAKNADAVSKVVSGSEIIVCAGPEGITLLPKSLWSYSDAKVLADVNAIPPYGIEGLDASDDGAILYGKRIGIGAMTIGGLKMKCHRQLVKKLFEEKGVIFDLEKVYTIAEGI